MTTYKASSATSTKTIAFSTNLSVCLVGMGSMSSTIVILIYISLSDLHRHVMTGSYHNYFRIFDVDSPTDVVLQADKSAFKAKKMGVQNRTRPLREQMNMETMDFNKKILHGSWHPRENTIAVSPFAYWFIVAYLN